MSNESIRSISFSRRVNCYVLAALPSLATMGGAAVTAGALYAYTLDNLRVRDFGEACRIEDVMRMVDAAEARGPLFCVTEWDVEAVDFAFAQRLCAFGLDDDGYVLLAATNRRAALLAAAEACAEACSHLTEDTRRMGQLNDLEADLRWAAAAWS